LRTPVGTANDAKARRGAGMKRFLIKYRRQNTPQDAWHRDIAEFIAALDADPALQGKISYCCMKSRDGSDYYHLATAVDEQAVKALQQHPSFSHYTDKTRAAAGGSVDVVPLEVVAETKWRA
jgi:hypothetical protein